MIEIIISDQEKILDYIVRALHEFREESGESAKGIVIGLSDFIRLVDIVKKYYKTYMPDIIADFYPAIHDVPIIRSPDMIDNRIYIV